MLIIVLKRGILIKIIQVIGRIDRQHTCRLHNNGIIHPNCKKIGRNHFALCTYGTLYNTRLTHIYSTGFFKIYSIKTQYKTQCTGTLLDFHPLPKTL